MRGGTGRLPERDDALDLVYVSIVFISYTVYMEAGRFSSRLPWWDHGFSKQDLDLSGTIFAI